MGVPEQEHVNHCGWYQAPISSPGSGSTVACGIGGHIYRIAHLQLHICGEYGGSCSFAVEPRSRPDQGCGTRSCGASPLTTRTTFSITRANARFAPARLRPAMCGVTITCG